MKKFKYFLWSDPNLGYGVVEPTYTLLFIVFFIIYI